MPEKRTVLVEFVVETPADLVDNLRDAIFEDDMDAWEWLSDAVVSIQEHPDDSPGYSHLKGA